MKYLLVLSALSFGVGFYLPNRLPIGVVNSKVNNFFDVKYQSKDSLPSLSSTPQHKTFSSVNHKIGIIVVDHGSKREEANKGLEKVNSEI